MPLLELKKVSSAYGSVEALRGNYRTALFYVDRALELKPDYADALHDRKEIERVMRQGEKKP